MLQAGLQRFIGQWVHTVCVQVPHVPTLSVFIFSRQAPNKDHSKQLSPYVILQFCANVKRDFIG